MSQRTHRIINTILAILYFPLSIFGFLMGMATEGAIGETNRLVIASCYVLACPGMLTPLTAYGGLFLSHRLFENGHIKASHFARFLALIVMAAAFLLAFLLDWLSKFFG